MPGRPLSFYRKADVRMTGCYFSPGDLPGGKVPSPCGEAEWSTADKVIRVKSNPKNDVVKTANAPDILNPGN